MPQLSAVVGVLLGPTMACSPPPTGGHDTAVVVIHRQGELVPQLAASDLDVMRLDALEPDVEQANVYVVAAGRAADEVIDIEPRRPNGQRENSVGPRRDELVSERLAVLQPAVNRAAREGSDDDVLRALDAASHTGAKRLIVLSAGLSTRDPLDLRVAGWDRDPDMLAQELLAQGALPNLADRQVIFSGLGRTAEPQPALGIREQTRLRSIWLALCTKAGGACTVNDSTRPAAPAVSPLPAAVVEIPAIGTTPGPHGAEIISVPSPLLFAPDSCTLSDRAAAAAVLAPLATRLRAGGAVVSISGRTAPVGPGTGVELASCRAHAAADVLLTDLQVPPSAIGEVRGDGSLLDPPEASHDQSGRLDPTKLAGLRRVIFTVTPTEEVNTR